MIEYPSLGTHGDHGYGRRNQCLFYGTGCYCRHRKTNLGYGHGLPVRMDRDARGQPPRTGGSGRR